MYQEIKGLGDKTQNIKCSNLRVWFVLFYGMYICHAQENLIYKMKREQRHKTSNILG